MFPSILQKNHNVLLKLAFFHILIIASSNYLVKIPFTIFEFNTTWGAFTVSYTHLTLPTNREV